MHRALRLKVTRETAMHVHGRPRRFAVGDTLDAARESPDLIQHALTHGWAVPAPAERPTRAPEITPEPVSGEPIAPPLTTALDGPPVKGTKSSRSSKARKA